MPKNPEKSEKSDEAQTSEGAKEAQEEIIRENESFNVPREDTPLEQKSGSDRKR